MILCKHTYSGIQERHLNYARYQDYEDHHTSGAIGLMFWPVSVIRL